MITLIYKNKKEEICVDAYTTMEGAKAFLRKYNYKGLTVSGPYTVTKNYGLAVDLTDHTNELED